MTAHRYSPLTKLMRRELVIAGRLFELTDWQVDNRVRAKTFGASGRGYAPDVRVTVGSKLHLIYMHSWGKPPAVEDVVALGDQLKDISAANPEIDCSACWFATAPIPDPISRLADDHAVWVLSPPHCIGYAHYLIDRLLGLRRPLAPQPMLSPNTLIQRLGDA